MPILYVNDGSPDSREYDSNYLYYEEDDLERMEAILRVIDRRAPVEKGTMTAERRALRKAIERCRRSDSADGTSCPARPKQARTPAGRDRGAVSLFIRRFFGPAYSVKRKPAAGDFC